METHKERSSKKRWIDGIKQDLLKLRIQNWEEILIDQMLYLFRVQVLRGSHLFLIFILVPLLHCGFFLYFIILIFLHIYLYIMQSNTCTYHRAQM